MNATRQKLGMGINALIALPTMSAGITTPPPTHALWIQGIDNRSLEFHSLEFLLKFIIRLKFLILLLIS